MNKLQIFTQGLIKNNPTFVLLLGMCPTLGTTSSAINGMGMGLATLFVLTLSNMAISMIKNVIPGKVRIPAFIVVIASFVTVLQLLMEAYVPALYAALGVFIPLIVVNCIILGRAEAYAGKNKVIPSIFDGIGMGLGFTVGLVAIGAVREIIGAGTLLGFQVLPESYEPVGIFIQAPGAFLVLALLTALLNKIRAGKPKKDGKPSGGCGSGGCAGCGNSSCAGKNL